MVEAGLISGWHQDGDLKKSAWVLCPSGVQGGQRARIERLPSGEPSGHDGGIRAVAPENLRGVPSLSAPKRQRREREPCVKSQKCPANSIAIRDK